MAKRARGLSNNDNLLPGLLKAGRIVQPNFSAIRFRCKSPPDSCSNPPLRDLADWQQTPPGRFLPAWTCNASVHTDGEWSTTNPASKLAGSIGGSGFDPFGHGFAHAGRNLR